MKYIFLLCSLLLAGCVAPISSLRSPETPEELAEWESFRHQVDRVGTALKNVQPRYCGNYCNFQVSMNVAAGIGAFADRKQIYITFPMLRFMNNDAELALIVGHEWAHLILGHTQSGNKVSDWDIEIQADCVGALFVKRSGYDINQSLGIYRRLMLTPAGLSQFLSPFSGSPTLLGRIGDVEKVAQLTAGRAITRSTFKQVCGVTL